MFNALAACFWVRLLIYSPKRFPWISVAGLALCTLGLGLAASRGLIMAALLGILLAMVVPFIVQPALRARILCLVALGAVLIVPTVLAKWDVLSRQFGVIVVGTGRPMSSPRRVLACGGRWPNMALRSFRIIHCWESVPGASTMPETGIFPVFPGRQPRHPAQHLHSGHGHSGHPRVGAGTGRTGGGYGGPLRRWIALGGWILYGLLVWGFRRSR